MEEEEIVTCLPTSPETTLPRKILVNQKFCELGFRITRA